MSGMVTLLSVMFVIW